MELPDKNQSPLRRFFKAFHYAFSGIKHGIMTERNLKFHFLAAVLVSILGLFLELSALEWVAVLFAFAGVIALELINSAIERTVDLVTEEYSHLAKQAKDLAAGAVLVYTIFVVIIGLIIFLPKIIELFF